MNKKFWVKNVLLEEGFLYENHEVVGTKSSLKHLLIEDGKIIVIQDEAVPIDDLPVVDAHGLLALPSFKEKHIHLDKGHFGGAWKASTPFVSVFDRIKEEEKFLPEFLSCTQERAESLLQLITSYGATFARVHCNVDPIIGLGNVERVQAALENYKDKLDYELVAFPQHGLLRSNSVSLMKEAMRKGVTIVGGLDPATIDNNIEASLDQMIDIAVEFNADVDMHLHNNGALGMYTIRRLIQKVEEAKWQGKVTLSHAYCMGESSLEEVSEIAEMLSAAQISVSTTSPIDVPAPPVPLLYQKGVKVNIINDNIHDHWSPFGTGDLLQRASRMAEKFGWIDEYSLTRALGFITEGKMPLNTKGEQVWPKIGDEASIVFVDASCSAEAVARISNRKAVMFKGTVVSGNL